ncbi:protein-methionine-sulfoxide reductase heme-binding subunit MsrQ [Luteimonas sp. A478]
MRPGRARSTSRTPFSIVTAKALVHALALAPLAVLLWQAWLVANGADIDALGADPVVEIEHRTGTWALRILLITLAITPLRQATGLVALMRFRRMLGLYAFFYASLHLTAFLILDLRSWWATVFEEILRRPYITVGFLAWLSLLPLAITSTRGWMRRLGRAWTRLHRLVYAAAVLAVLHFWWIVKSDLREPLIYASILAVLLGWRLWRRHARRRGGIQPAP